MFTRLILSGGDKIHSQEVHFELLWSFLSPKNYVNDVFIASDEVHHLCVKIYSQFYIYVVIQSQKNTHNPFLLCPSRIKLEILHRMSCDCI